MLAGGDSSSRRLVTAFRHTTVSRDPGKAVALGRALHPRHLDPAPTPRTLVPAGDVAHQRPTQFAPWLRFDVVHTVTLC